MSSNTIDPISWQQILGIVVGSGIISTILHQVIEWLKERRARAEELNKERRYLYLCIAVELERYSIECARQIEGNQLADDSDGHAGTLNCDLPELGMYPTNVDWRESDIKLTSRALSFPNEIRLGKYNVDTILEFIDDNKIDHINETLGTYGYRALILAYDLRAAAGIQSIFSQEKGWDPSNRLKEFDEKAKRRKQCG